MKLKRNLTTRLKVLDRFLDTRLEKVTLPGFKRNSIYRVGKFFVSQVYNEDLNLRASSMAFNFFIAIFPTIIFLFTLIAYVPIADLDVRINGMLDQFLPDGAYGFLQETINDILNTQNAGLLSFGFLAALYFSSNGFASMLSAFDAGIDRKMQRSWINERLKASMMMILVVLLLVTTIAVSISLTYAVQVLNDSVEIIDLNTATFLQITEFILTVLLVYIIFSSIYYFGSVKGDKWRFFTAGSSLGTILSLITTRGFISYVENFNSYNKLYGSVGTLLVIMFLIYFNCFVVLIGFELNRSIDKATLRGASLGPKIVKKQNKKP